MTTHIMDQYGRFFSEGKNLRVVLSHAKKRGVLSIEGIRQANGNILLNMHYTDGFTAVYNFSSESVCRAFHDKRWPGKLVLKDEYRPHNRPYI